MPSAPLPPNEVERIEALLRLQILDSPAEEAFDEITRSVARQLEVPISVVTLIDEERQWFKSCYGLDLDETSRDVSFCAHALTDPDPLIVEDTQLDPRFLDNPLVTMPNGLRSYCGAPLVLSGGEIMGSLCVADVKPRHFSATDVTLLRSLSRVVVHLLELRTTAKQVFEQERASALAAKSETAESRAELKQTEERLRDIAENLPGLVYQFKIDAGGHWSFPFISGRVAAILGLDPNVVMQDPDHFLARVHPDDRGGFERSVSAAHEQASSWHWEGRMICVDGQVGWFRGSSAPRPLDGGGMVWNGFILDISEWRQMEERLRQAQKMEAIGQLTGGVAHDFNNLLAVVQGNAELLADRLGESDSAVSAILRVSTRGSELTQRLLAFSRQQSLNPRPVDLGSLICGMTDWLRRLLGNSIVISACSDPDLWPARVDAGEVENVVLNLALNARDAMPKGGRLCISMDNVTRAHQAMFGTPDLQPGDYVRLSVKDCGVGMPPAVQARAFEPFFTTKAVGEGSGLGLSTAYGFAQQSGGHISIDSEAGKGTEISLFLPKALDEVERDRPEESKAANGKGQGERILLLEDDDEVRRMAERMLVSAGYQVTAVASASEARHALEEVGAFRLLLSDVVLGGEQNGPEFAAEATARFPELRVLFVSGYPASSQDRSMLSLDATVLRKPFKQRVLSKAVRLALDNGSIDE